jgi:hypothetical protein
MTSIEFFGEQFDLNAEVSEFALMEFAEVAADGVDAEMMEGLAAMMRLVKECIIAADVSRFLKTARKNRAASKELLPILEATFNATTERPTSQPSDSSDGLSVIEPSSVVNSADKGLERLNGRPDLQLAVLHSRSA